MCDWCCCALFLHNFRVVVLKKPAANLLVHPGTCFWLASRRAIEEGKA